MDILTNKKVKTRKPHICHGCVYSYPKGSQMRYTTSVDAGDISSAYWCNTCDVVIDRTYDAYDLQDGIRPGEVREKDVEYWDSVNISLNDGKS